MATTTSKKATHTSARHTAKSVAGSVLSQSAPVVRMASGQRVVAYSLADPEMADRVAELQRRIQNTPGLGVTLLKRAKILNRSGKTSKAFGG